MTGLGSLRSAVVVAWLVLGAADDIWACTPVPLSTHFWSPEGQDLPFDRIVEDGLGPFERLRPMEAFVAYRRLTDRPLTDQDRSRLIAYAREPATVESPAGSPAQRWLNARARVVGGQPTGFIASHRWGDAYQAYRNCLGDAFVTATRALESRIRRWGLVSREVRAWLAGQDLVFANCKEGVHTPEALGEDWPEDLRFDREYQIAAAMFYSARWADAEQRFLAIADDLRSPWSLISGYVAARAMLRQNRFEDAALQLRAVLDDEVREPVHAAAARLLRHVRYRSEPKVIHAETRSALLARVLPDDFDRIWDDYRWGLRYVADLDDDFDLWMVALTRRSGQPEDEDLRKRVVARWQRAGGAAWRLAALATSNRRETDRGLMDDVLAACDDIADQASEAVAMRYHCVRQLADAGRFDEASSMLSALRSSATDWPDGARNHLAALEVRLAPDLRGLIDAAVARPVALFSGHRAVPFERFGVDRDRTGVMDLGGSVLQRLSMRTLAALSASSSLPAGWASRLLEVAFVRALVLGDRGVASQLASRVVQEVPVMAEHAEHYRKAPPEEQDFVAALILLRSGASPWFRVGTGSADPRPWEDARWWCRGLRLPEAYEPLPPLRAELKIRPTEVAALRALPPAPALLAERVLPWALANPDDPRVPEALHRLVAITRRPCGQTFPAISKQAFDLLHRRYPSSPWTEKTPYWFGD